MVYFVVWWPDQSALAFHLVGALLEVFTIQIQTWVEPDTVKWRIPLITISRGSKIMLYVLYFFQVENIRFPQDGNRMKGFGYAEFFDREQLKRALALNNVEVRWNFSNAFHVCMRSIICCSASVSVSTLCHVYDFV